MKSKWNVIGLKYQYSIEVLYCTTSTYNKNYLLIAFLRNNISIIENLN